MPMACRLRPQNGCDGGLWPPIHALLLSLAPVTPGFALFAADFAPAPWLGHAKVSFPGRLGWLK